MDLNHLNHGEHKHFIQNNAAPPETLEDLVAQLCAQKNSQEDQSSSLFKLIKESDLETSSFVAKSFCVKSENQDQSKPTEPEQFSRFIQFIKSISNKTCQAEMSMFLYPVFIHSYLEMLERCQIEQAYGFAEKYKKLFSKTKEYSKFVEELVCVKNARDIVSSQRVRLFRENRYSLKISEDTFSTLETFFTQEVNFPFLELIQSKLDLTISDLKDLDEGPETEPCEDEEEEKARKDEKSNSDEFRANYDHIPEYRRYLEAKKNMEKVPPKPSSLMCWNIHNLEDASCAEVNSDASLLVSASLNGRIVLSELSNPMIYDVVTVPVNSVPLANPGLEPATIRLMKRTDGMYMNVYGNKGAVHDVSFVPDSKYFLSVSSDNYMRAYSVDTYNCVMKYSGHDLTVWSVEACSKGLALTASRDSTARLWSLEHLYPLRIFVGHKQDVTCAKFHPKVTYIGTGSYDKAVRLWSITDGSSVRIFPDHEAPVLSIAFSPCGKFLASGGEDGLVLIHELTTGRVLSRFHLSGFEPVTSLVWSTTGETVVAGSVSGIVQMNAWPSRAKIGMMDTVNTVTYHNTLERLLNIQFKKSPPGAPLCLGVQKETEENTFVVKEQPTTQA
uniref:TAF5-like RNA polymerase II p300/CBP-associated factor-associated factor 65 kDa subunit 5L n=1 Tax=Cacopsylla melanoneura TaxID=428564 RepID=A0A8D8SGS8_9HEMI